MHLEREKREMSESLDVRDVRPEDGYFMDTAILDEYGQKLGPYGIAVYSALCRCARQGTCESSPSVATIADLIGAGTTKVREMLHLLDELGLIDTQNRKYESNLYTILNPQGLA
jgi:hypothetical protein